MIKPGKVVLSVPTDYSCGWTFTIIIGTVEFKHVGGSVASSSIAKEAMREFVSKVNDAVEHYANTTFWD
jgi:hypothetical protein